MLADQSRATPSATPHFPGIPLPPPSVLILTGPSDGTVMDSGEASRDSSTEDP